MYPHVFPPHWIKGFWYNFFHPHYFFGISGGLGWESCGFKRLGEGHMGEDTLEDTMTMDVFLKTF